MCVFGVWLLVFYGVGVLVGVGAAVPVSLFIVCPLLFINFHEQNRIRPNPRLCHNISAMTETFAPPPTELALSIPYKQDCFTFQSSASTKDYAGTVENYPIRLIPSVHSSFQPYQHEQNRITMKHQHGLETNKHGASSLTTPSTLSGPRPQKCSSLESDEATPTSTATPRSNGAAAVPHPASLPATVQLSLPATMQLVALDLPRNRLNELPAYVREHASSVTFPEKV
jgi:hypothetical protein